MIIVPGRRRRDRRARAPRAADRDAEGRLDARPRPGGGEVLEFATGPGLLPGAAGPGDRARRRRRRGATRSTTRGPARSSRRRRPSSRRSSAASRRPTAGRSSSASGTPRTSSRSPAARSRCASPRWRTSTATRRRSRLCSPRSLSAGVDLIVFCGDLTWGPLPNETLARRPRDRDAGALRARQRRPLGRRAIWTSEGPGWPRSTTPRRPRS